MRVSTGSIVLGITGGSVINCYRRNNTGTRSVLVLDIVAGAWSVAATKVTVSVAFFQLNRGGSIHLDGGW